MRTSSAWAFASVAALCVAGLDAQGAGSLTGRLTASESPLPDCTISLYRLHEGQSRYVENIVTRTAANGSYRFDSLEPAAYILLGTCGNRRVYQGRLSIQAGPNVRDISLDDPFSGRWTLDPARSKMGVFSGFRDEQREYRRVGAVTTMSWSRTDRNGKRTQGAYRLTCDGTEQKVAGQQMTCRFVGPDTVEGYQKPPLSYYVRQVSGNTLTISTYSDAARSQLTSMLVFTRQP